MDAPRELTTDIAPPDWTAYWIWDEGIPRTVPGEHEVRYFRRTFQAEPGARLTVRVSADSRYELFLNGERVSVGPCKGDYWRQHYETVDVSPYLHAGQNILAARVLHFHTAEPYRMDSVGISSVYRAAYGGFFLQGEWTGEGECVDTNGQWLVLRGEGIRFHATRGAELFGQTEDVEGGLLPHGWTDQTYDDSRWIPAVPFYPGLSPDRKMCTDFSCWNLTPRPIPPLYETRRGLACGKVALGNHTGSVKPKVVSAALCGLANDAELPPDSEWTIDLDAGELTTGYIRLSVSGGKGSEIRLTYAEAYGQGEEGQAWVKKGIRDDPAEGGIFGLNDRYRPGGADETYQPFWFRTFRFVRVHIKVGAEPLVVRPLTYIETGYPLEVRSRFESADPRHAELWDISVRTVQRCLHETFIDCPYYEQLQYTMDTRLEALFAACMTGDTRPMLKAIHDYHCSWHPSGLVQSRTPTVVPQIIPGFALHWIFMLYDHWSLTGDREVPRRYRSAVDSVLDWFDRRLTPDGLVGGFYYWPYFDWVKGWDAGMPPGSPDKPATVFSQLYASALKTAAELAEPAGYAHRAGEYRERAAEVNAAVRRYCWDGKSGLFRDSPGLPATSVHPQVWAILSGAASEELRSDLALACLEDKSLSQMNWAMQFYLFRALKKAGLYHRAYELFDQWIGLADLHVTTWPEDPIHGRSDCHGWGSVPIYEFVAETLGVQPAKPGFEAVRIAPQPGPLAWANGTVATRRGDVRVSWEIEDGACKVHASGPPDTRMIVVLPGGRTVEGVGEITAA